MTEIIYELLDASDTRVSGELRGSLPRMRLRATEFEQMGLFAAMPAMTVSFYRAMRRPLPRMTLRANQSPGLWSAHLPRMTLRARETEPSSIAGRYLIAAMPAMRMEASGVIVRSGRIEALLPRQTLRANQSPGLFSSSIPALTWRARERELPSGFVLLLQGAGYLSAAVGVYGGVMNDSIVTEDASGSSLIMSLVERVRPVATAVSFARFMSQASELVRANDAVGLLLWGIMQDDAIASDDADTRSAAILEMMEAVYAVDAMQSSLEGITAFETALSLLDASSVFSVDAATDGLTAADAAESSMRAVGAMLDQIVVDATPDNTATMIVSARESATVDGDAGTSLSGIASARDDVSVLMRMSVLGETFIGYVANTESKGFSTYDNVPFENMCQVGRSYFGLTSAGIMKLGGDNDDGDAIRTRLKTGLSDMGSGRMKRIVNMYLLMESDGPSILKVIETSEGVKREYWYKVKRQRADVTRESATTVGYGLRSVYYQFELESIGKMNIDAIQFQPLYIQRRV